MKHTDATATLRTITETLRRAEDLHWSDAAFQEWERKQVGDVASTTINVDRNVMITRWEPGPGAYDEDDGHHIRPMIDEIDPDRPTSPMTVRTYDYTSGVDVSGPLMLGPEPETAPENEDEGEQPAGMRGISPTMCIFDEAARFTPHRVRELQRLLDVGGHATRRVQIHFSEAGVRSEDIQREVFVRSRRNGQRNERLRLTGRALGLTEETADEVIAAWLTYYRGTPLPVDWSCIERSMISRALGEPWEPEPSNRDVFRENLRAAWGPMAEAMADAFDRIRPAMSALGRAMSAAHEARRSDFVLVPGWDPGAPVDPRTVTITNDSREVLLDWRDRRPRPWTAYTAGPQHRPRRHHRRGPDPRTLSATITPRRAGRRP
ncbi:hypothetical protein [Nocardiopsis sp. YSL2]|uniref:hypothetical protein n=1 Tax=Nocardiopsis sp. YSL2 TaxID=2939492 RepID=UPI0026F43CFD|nr:hypothetical protein [Nocardiopsis sp. YSL2]